MGKSDWTMPQFTVVELDAGKADLVYPLVRTVAPEISPKQWSAYARTLGRKGGLLGLIGADGAPIGFLSYRREMALRHGPVLHIDNFVTFEFNSAAPGRQALSEAAEALAHRLGCAAMELRLGSRGYTDDSSVKARGWASLGHSLDAVVFTKQLTPA